MQYLTLELVRENPWNAVELILPETMDDMLLKAALAAVAYCRASEFAFAVAANEKRYQPPAWWRPDAKFREYAYACSFREEVECRWQDASERYMRLVALCGESLRSQPCAHEVAYL